MTLPHEKQFHFSDGSAAASINDLKKKIESMSYDEFYGHVGQGRNDFANWIRYVMQDEGLADTLEKVSSIVETVEVLNDYLYPKPAQKHLKPPEDIQSHIEHDELGMDEFTLGKTLKAARDREATNQTESPEPTPDSNAEGMQVEAEERIEEAAEPEFADEEEPSKPEPEPAAAGEVSHHYKREPAESEELRAYHHDVDKMIARDLIIGFFFGLLVGLFLGRVLL